MLLSQEQLCWFQCPFPIGNLTLSSNAPLTSFFLCLLLPQSDGVEQTNYLAQRYCQEAIRQISRLRPSPERDALIRLTEMVLTRDK